VKATTVGIGAIARRTWAALARKSRRRAEAEAPKPARNAAAAPQPAASNGAAKQAPPSVQRIAAENNVDLSGVSAARQAMAVVTKSDALAIIENRGAQQQQRGAAHPPLARPHRQRPRRARAR
jgi:pyruvate/2-oxoglutarate dehydrogenase complex dihydrolipoamide acyltransferase (E2) component